MLDGTKLTLYTEWIKTDRCLVRMINRIPLKSELVKTVYFVWQDYERII